MTAEEARMTTEDSNQAVMLGLTQHPRGSWLTVRQDDDRGEARMTTEVSNQAVMLGLTQHPRGSWLTIRQDDDGGEAG